MVAPEGTGRFPKAEPRRSYYSEASVASAGTSTVAATGTKMVASGGTIGLLVYP